MKKIYILTAVFALLTLSLNAQLLPYKAVGKNDVYPDKGKPASTVGLFRAPAKINTADGEFLVGPYTTDYFSTTGKGLYSTTGEGRVEVSTVIPRADIEQYIGQEIVGYRFATVGGTVSCYSFLVEGEGPNYYIDDLYYWNIQSDGTYYDLSGSQWHEFYLDEPVVFQIPDTTQAIWIGYKYWQESSNNGNYTMTPIAVNPNVTNYDCFAYSYNQNNQGFYDVTSTLGGAVAAQLIFKEASTDPKITASPTSVSMSTKPGETVTETVTVTGANLTNGITATISGTDAAMFSVSPASLGTSGGSLTVTYSPTAVGTHTATLTLSSTGAQDVIITLNGTCSSEVTICEGTNTNGYLPIYGLYTDDYQINQMIYPEGLLGDLVGKTLTSMTFYATGALDANLSSVAWNVKLGTTSQTAFASSLSQITRLVPDDVTTVAQGYVITSGINTMTITFTTPFTYDGGNLLIDFQSTNEGQYKSTDFYGVNQSTYTGYNSYRSSDATPNQNGHYSGGGARQFLPKVTFTVEDNNKTATPEITYVVNGDNVVITATGDGTVNLTTSDGQSASGNGSASITVPRTDATFSVTATATAQESGKLESDPATETITIPFLQTAAPSISVSEPDANGNVVVTATGDGTVTLTTTDGQSVSGSGSVSITLPQQAHDYTVTATAQAQESGKAASETVTQSVTVPGKIDDTWKEMLGTYTNPNDLLSFQIKVGNDTTDIMLIDQFLAPTIYNVHPDSYIYTITETINGEEKSSNPVDIPVYKTSSTLKGLYTFNQVETDTLMNLRADVMNAEMNYDVNPGEHTYFYGLYRGDKNADYPTIDQLHRISQLQKYDEMVGEHVQYFFKETYPSGIAPRYEHIGAQMVERLDTNYVEGVEGDELSYVPVIWTFGLYTARGDGKNNSYGSDIKREKLGGVNIDFIKGTLSTNNENHQNDYGTWEAPDGTTYCVYTPFMRVSGIQPADLSANDGDEYTYEPYMYRVWCIYPNARDFTREGKLLADNGALPDTILLQTVYVDDPTLTSVYFGKEQWVEADGKLPYAIGVPVSVANNPSVLQFVVRFYYKKNVVEGGQNNDGAKKLRDGEENEYFVAQNRGTGQDVGTFVNEMFNNRQVVNVTYVNSVGMKSDKPFDGVNIVITRYDDGTTSTTKVMR